MIEFNKKALMLLLLVNITLAVDLILLSNDVSTNPGPPKAFRIYHLNICSLCNKVDELRLFCERHKPHILTLNETWLGASFDNDELLMPGYGIFRNDRNKFGGRMAIYVDENLAYEEIQIIKPRFCRGNKFKHSF